MTSPEPARTAPGPAWGASGLDASYRGVRALAGVTLWARPGTVTAVAGGDGAGKSTLLRCLSGAIGDALVTVVDQVAWAEAFARLAAAGLPVALAGRALRVPGAGPGPVRDALGGLPARIRQAPVTLEERFFQLTLSSRETAGAR